MIKSFRNILALEDLRADIHVARFQTYLSFLNALLGYLLQLIESLLTVACLMTSCLRHSAHPFQLPSVQVVGSHDLSPRIVDTLLSFLQIIRIVAAVSIDGTVVQLQNQVTHLVQEITVVCHHQQCFVPPCQIALQPFNHLQVEVVRGLIENQQVRFGNQYVGQRHPFLLTAAELSHGLLQVAYLQLCQYLLGPQHLLLFPLVIETSVNHLLFGIEHRRLLQHGHFQVATEDDLPVVVPLLTRNHREQGGFSSTVLCYQSHLLSFGNTERDMLEQHLCAERFREILYVEKGNSHDVLFRGVLQLFVDTVDIVEHLITSQFLLCRSDEVGWQNLPRVFQLRHIRLGVHLRLHRS